MDNIVQGIAGTGITAPTGGSGVLGWLSGIYNKVGSGGSSGGASLADQSVVDTAGVYWLVRDSGTSLTYVNLATGNVGTPTGATVPAGKLTGEQLRSTQYDVVTAASGYSIGDVLEHIVILNIATTPATIVTSVWLNITQAAVLSSAPVSANIVEIDASVAISSLPSIPAGSAAIGSVTLGGSLPGFSTTPTVDTVVKTTAIDRGAVIGFTGAVVSTTNGSNTINLTTAPTSGATVLGQQITAAGIPTGSYIYALASGSLNVVGSTYTLSSSSSSLVASNATATATGIAATSVGPQQIAPANSIRRGVAYQVQSTTANVWTNGVEVASADFHSLKIPSGTYYETSPAHSGTGAISAIADTPATSLYAREW